MGKCCRVDESAIHRARQALNQLHEFAFMVGLVPRDIGTSDCCPISNRQFYVRQCDAAVDVWFPDPYQVEVGPIQDGDSHLGLETLEPISEIVIRSLIGLIVGIR